MYTPDAVSLKRIVKEPMTLSDGLSLPVDAYVCVVNSATFDRETETFDAFRYSKKREGGNGAPSTRDQYTTTDRDHITFGHGRYACPGRFIAAVETKMVLAEMLQRYDIKFSGTSGRPKPLQAFEIAFQDPRTRVLIRER
jgi:cytochrome P450